MLIRAKTMPAQFTFKAIIVTFFGAVFKNFTLSGWK